MTADDAPIGRSELKALMRRSDRPGLIRLFWWCVTLLCTASLVYASIGTWFVVPAMFVHGIVVVHHFALQHECSHYTAFRSRWLCRALARLCGFLLVIPPLFFRYEHCDHHTHTNLRGRDPELIELPTSLRDYLLYLSALPYWRSQLGGLLRRARGILSVEERRFVPRTERGAVIRESRLMLAGYAATAGATLVFGWSWPLLYWWLPMLLAEPVMRFIRMTEHVGRPTIADRRVNTRTSLVAAPWRWLAWNMNYHAEHHYAPSVPFHALGRLHRRLHGHLHVERAGYLAAHRDIVGRILNPVPGRPSHDHLP